MSFKRLLKAMLGRDPWIRIDERVAVVRIGSDYGGWTIRPDRLRAHPVVYSAGVGMDVTFDLGVIERFGAEVHAFDPTPRSLSWVQSQTFPGAFTFHPIGVADRDGELRFVPPEDPTHVSYSASESGTDDAIACPVERVGTIMRRLGHERLDVLKLDIEGSEYGVIADLAGSDLPIAQLLVEFHHGTGGYRVRDTVAAVALLRSAGFRLFHIAPSGREYSFWRPDAS